MFIFLCNSQVTTNVWETLFIQGGILERNGLLLHEDRRQFYVIGERKVRLVVLENILSVGKGSLGRG